MYTFICRLQGSQNNLIIQLTNQRCSSVRYQSFWNTSICVFYRKCISTVFICHLLLLLFIRCLLTEIALFLGHITPFTLYVCCTVCDCTSIWTLKSAIKFDCGGEGITSPWNEDKEHFLKQLDIMNVASQTADVTMALWNVKRFNSAFCEDRHESGKERKRLVFLNVQMCFLWCVCVFVCVWLCMCTWYLG